MLFKMKSIKQLQHINGMILYHVNQFKSRDPRIKMIYLVHLTAARLTVSVHADSFKFKEKTSVKGLRMNE